MSILDEVLLVLAGGVDRGDGGSGLLAAAGGREDAGEERAKNTHGELSNGALVSIR